MSRRSGRDLADRLTDPAEARLDAGLLIPLLRLLADGEPIPISPLAAASGRTDDDVRDALAAGRGVAAQP